MEEITYEDLIQYIEDAEIRVRDAEDDLEQCKVDLRDFEEEYNNKESEL